MGNLLAYKNYKKNNRELIVDKLVKSTRHGVYAGPELYIGEIKIEKADTHHPSVKDYSFMFCLPNDAADFAGRALNLSCNQHSVA
jgi:hypothetical protein